MDYFYLRPVPKVPEDCNDPWFGCMPIGKKYSWKIHVAMSQDAHMEVNHSLWAPQQLNTNLQPQQPQNHVDDSVTEFHRLVNSVAADFWLLFLVYIPLYHQWPHW